jgi:hypothetical protein
MYRINRFLIKCQPYPSDPRISETFTNFPNFWHSYWNMPYNITLKWEHTRREKISDKCGITMTSHDQRDDTWHPPTTTVCVLSFVLNWVIDDCVVFCGKIPVISCLLLWHILLMSCDAVGNSRNVLIGSARLNCGPSVGHVDPYFFRGMPIPSDLSDFPLANSCGNGTYVFEISWMCVSRLENFVFL